MNEQDFWQFDPLENGATEPPEETDNPSEDNEWLARLTLWSAPRPTSAATLDLIGRLTPFLPPARPVSRVRQALQEPSSASLWSELTAFTRLASAQVSVLGLPFWVLSLLLSVLGFALTLGLSNQGQTLTLRLFAPALAFLSTASAFRGNKLGVLELELACPPTPFKLMLTRLAVVLSYDIVLGLSGSLGLWLSGRNQFSLILELTLHWLTPLLLIVGLSLLLALYCPLSVATSISYATWIALVVLAEVSQHPQSGLYFPLTGRLEIALGVFGLFCGAFSLVRLYRHGLSSWLSRREQPD